MSGQEQGRRTCQMWVAACGRQAWRTTPQGVPIADAAPFLPQVVIGLFPGVGKG